MNRAPEIYGGISRKNLINGVYQMVSPSEQNFHHTINSQIIILYRCNRCLSIEHIPLGSQGVSFVIPCTKCGGLAVKQPVQDSIFKMFNSTSSRDKFG
jgi:hypothetical protein